MSQPKPVDRPTVVHPGLGPDAIRAAVDRIPAQFRDTPQYVHEGLSDRLGAPVVVKIETSNPVGAFKGRGTWLAIRGLVERGEVSFGRPVVVASTGNFGQGVAYAARASGVPAVVFCDEHANKRKVARIRRLGAEVRQVGRDFDEARAASEAFAAGRSLALLVDGDDVLVAVGAATMALEITDAVQRGELPPIANAYVPLGNGALLVGVGAWLRERGGECRIVGIQAAGAPSMEMSWRAGHPIETTEAMTYAEGIATRVPVPAALRLMDGRVDDVLLVGEGALRAAEAELVAELGITVEGSAAASWAGLLADADRRAGACLVLVTGSNVAAE
jgi:threonine dehydratase